MKNRGVIESRRRRTKIGGKIQAEKTIRADGRCGSSGSYGLVRGRRKRRPGYLHGAGSGHAIRQVDSTLNCRRPDALRKGQSGQYEADETYSYRFSTAIPQVIREIHASLPFSPAIWAMTQTPIGVPPARNQSHDPFVSTLLPV